MTIFICPFQTQCMYLNKPDEWEFNLISLHIYVPHTRNIFPAKKNCLLIYTSIQLSIHNKIFRSLRCFKKLSLQNIIIWIILKLIVRYKYKNVLVNILMTTFKLFYSLTQSFECGFDNSLKKYFLHLNSLLVSLKNKNFILNKILVIILIGKFINYFFTNFW